MASEKSHPAFKVSPHRYANGVIYHTNHYDIMVNTGTPAEPYYTVVGAAVVLAGKALAFIGPSGMRRPKDIINHAENYAWGRDLPDALAKIKDAAAAAAFKKTGRRVAGQTVPHAVAPAAPVDLRGKKIVEFYANGMPGSRSRDKMQRIIIDNEVNPLDGIRAAQSAAGERPSSFAHVVSVRPAYVPPVAPVSEAHAREMSARDNS